jgi:hypothetical protein
MKHLLGGRDHRRGIKREAAKPDRQYNHGHKAKGHGRWFCGFKLKLLAKHWDIQSVNRLRVNLGIIFRPICFLFAS